MKKTYLVAILLVVVRTAMGVDIIFSGGTIVCPNISYTYTAQAVGAFGSQKGCFQWGFFVNDQLVSTAGSAPCDCGSSFSTSTATMTWGTVTTNAKIRIDFVADDIFPGCPVSSKTVNVVVRVVTPESITDANGGLTFCSANQTRTVSVPASTACNWNHNYDWILPSGWTAVPSSASFSYISIPGGIRTKSNSVNCKGASHGNSRICR